MPEALPVAAKAAASTAAVAHWRRRVAAPRRRRTKTAPCPLPRTLPPSSKVR